jgi:hypothetical protein
MAHCMNASFQWPTDTLRATIPPGSAKKVAAFFNLSLVEKRHSRPNRRDGSPYAGGLRNFLGVCAWHSYLDGGWQSWPVAKSLLTISHRRANRPDERSKAWPRAPSRRSPSLFPRLLPRKEIPGSESCSSLLERCPSSAATARFMRRRRNSSISSAAATGRRGHQNRATRTLLRPRDC